MDQDKIGKFILQLRTERKLSQYQLADMVPISRQAVSKWERGVSIPDSSTLIRLSEIFKVSINELLAGKRLKGNSIKELENTTLSILDENNKKARKIKRNFKISITIITTLLLTFLSYYFINSYNSTKVYTISGVNEHFRISDGLYVTTKNKSYMKLSQIEHSEDITINKIKLYYIKDKKEKIIFERERIDDYTMTDYEGYLKGVSSEVLKKCYINITYNDNQNEIIKLKFIKDFTNNNLLFKEKRKYKTKVKNIKKLQSKKDEETIQTVTENSTQEEIKVVENISGIKEELSSIENHPVTLVHDSVLLSDQQEEPKIEKLVEEATEEVKETEPVVETNKDIINPDEIKTYLKDNSFYYEGTYIYEIEDEGLMFMYNEEIDLLTLYKDDDFLWDYYFEQDRYNCSLYIGEDCKDEVLETLKKYLVKGGN